MSKGNTTENDLLKLFFQKTLASWMGTLGTTGDDAVTLALHTADPGEGGTQSTSEATYDSYARVPVSRSAVYWTVTDNVVENASLVQFPEATGGSNTITHVSIGINSGQIMYSGELTSPRSVSSGIQPQFAAGSLTVTED